MKRIMIIAAAVIGLVLTYFIANLSYQTNINNAFSKIKESLELKGYDVEYENIESNILNDYITVKKLKLEKNSEIITLDNFKVNRTLFEKESSQLIPKSIEFSMQNLISNSVAESKNGFDVEYQHKLDDKTNNFISKIKVKNKEVAEIDLYINLKDSLQLWNCINKEDRCDLFSSEEKVKESIGAIAIENLDFTFKNKGIIQNEINKFNISKSNINDIKTFAIKKLDKMNIKEQDKQTLANFVETLDTIKINIKNKENVTLVKSLSTFKTKILEKEMNNPNDFVNFMYNQVEIKIE